MKWRMNAARVWVGLTAIVLLAGMAVPTQAVQAISRENLSRGLLATVKVYTLNAQGKAIASCSGTVVEGTGHILTNWHCVGLTNDQTQDDSGQGLKPGDLYHPKGLIVVAPTVDSKQVPKPTYVAQVLAGTPKMDIAVARIVGMLDESEPLPESLPLVVQPLGDSNTVQIGDQIHVIGYPGVGGPLVTLTSGQVAGFDDRNNDGEIDSIKTDASIAHGNSGGPVLNEAGEQIGIATWGIEEGAKAIDRLMMINLAIPYIQQAVNRPKADPGSSPLSTSATDSPSGNGPFSAILFGTGISDQGRLIGEATQFAAATERVFGVFGYQGMRNGTKWGVVWQHDGQVVVEEANSYVWDLGEQGATYASLHHDKGLPGGAYALVLYVDGQAVQRGSFSITASTDQPPARPGSDGVVLSGEIVDADTSRPIPNAALVVLKPGVTVAQWDQSDGNSLAAALGVTDESGVYHTAPGLARGQTYTILASAQGYERRAFVDGLSLANADPNLWQAAPVALKKL